MVPSKALDTPLQHLRDNTPLIGGASVLLAADFRQTLIINLLLAKQRQIKHIALAVTSSGIASTLLSGDRKAHSCSKLPLDLSKKEMETCNISHGFIKVQLVSDCKLIIWDVATMLHKGSFDALDTVLQGFRHKPRPMGGETV